MRPLKATWFVNVPIPPMTWRDGTPCHVTGGSWLYAYAQLAAERLPELKLSVVCAYPGLPEQRLHVNGVEYISFNHDGQLWSSRDLTSRSFQKCLQLSNETSPDLLHVFGTERWYGLLAEATDVPPVVVSLQAVVSAITDHGLLLSSAFPCRLGSLFGVSRRGLDTPLLSFRRHTEWRAAERRVFACVRHFFGRTTWDRAWVRCLAPDAHYYYLEEPVRPELLSGRWSIDTCARHRLFATNPANGYYRGLDVIVKALAILLRDYPDAQLFIAGEEEKRGAFAKWVKEKTAVLPNGTVVYTGRLDAEGIRKHMLNAHTYLNVSRVENSPLALSEAMCLGVPSIVSYAGGLTSRVEHGITGLHVPPGDAVSLANAIRQLWSHDALATNIGSNAQQLALRRHDPASIAQQLIRGYQSVLGIGSVHPCEF